MLKHNTLAFGLVALLATSAIHIHAQGNCADADTNSDAEYSTIADAATTAGLTELATVAGTTTYADAIGDAASAFTVFAPDNAAFQASNAFLNEASTDADAVIGTHIVAGATMSSALTDGMKLTTVTGATLTVNLKDGGVTVTDGNGRVATVTSPDTTTCNSVVHVVNTVLYPLTCADGVTKSVYDVASGQANLSELTKAVEGSTYATDASTPASELTVFAPVNGAFNAAPVQELLAGATAAEVDAILGTHIVAGRVLAADLTDGQMVETVTGEMLTVNISDADPAVVTVTDGNGGVATVVNADVTACNSVIHVVDAVLTPKAAAAVTCAAGGEPVSILDVADGQDSLKAFREAVRGSAYETAASDPASVLTVFAPTNAAFATDAVTTLLAAATTADVDGVLGTHIVEGYVTSADLTDGQMVETISGQMLTVNVSTATPPVITVTDPNGRVATVTTADVVACNSAVHIVSEVLTPELPVVAAAASIKAGVIAAVAAVAVVVMAV